MTAEPPVELFVPPEVVAQSTVPRPPASPQAESSRLESSSASLALGITAVDRSGRVRDRVVLGALGWKPGERTLISVRARALLAHRVDRGGAMIDARGRVFLPVAARTQLAIEVDERLLLVAVPGRDLLIVHPLSVLATLLTDYYALDSRMLDDEP